MTRWRNPWPTKVRRFGELKVDEIGEWFARLWDHMEGRYYTVTSAHAESSALRIRSGARYAIARLRRDAARDYLDAIRCIESTTSEEYDAGKRTLDRAQVILSKMETKP